MNNADFISKSLVKQVVTILNKYVNNPHLICGYTKFPSHINISIQVWTLDSLILGQCIGHITKDINAVTDITFLEEKINEELNKISIKL